MTMVKFISPVAIALLAGTAVSLTGCSKEDPSQVAIQRAATNLSAVSGGGSSPATNAAQQKSYDDAGKLSQGVSGSAAMNSAASLISATASAGKATVPSTASSSSIGGADMTKDGDLWRVSEIGLVNRMRSLRVLAAQYADLKEAAAAAAAFKPGDQFTELDHSVAELDTLAGERNKVKGELDAQIAQLMSKAKAKSDEAAGIEKRAGEIRSQVSKLSATEAAKVVEQASTLKRSADKLRLEAQLIDADASQLRAQLPEVELALGQIDAQKKGIAQAKADLRSKVDDCSKVATKADADAAKIASQIDGEVNELKKSRESAWARSNDERLSMLRQALSAAQKAGSDPAMQSKLAIGTFQQSIGDVHLSRAIEARSYELLMDALADTSLPNASAYKTEAGAAGKVREEAAASAKAAYEAAKAAFNGAPVRGGKDSADVKARLEKIGKSLESVIEALNSGSNASLKEWGYSDAPSDDQPKPAAPAAAAPKAAAAGTTEAPAELLAAVDAIAAAGASGDWSKIEPLCQATSPLAQQALKIAASTAKLEAACKAKFGKSFTETAGAAGGMSSFVDAGQLSKLDPKTLKFTVEGDKASAAVGAGKLSLVKVGDQWKVDVDSQVKVIAANPMAAGMMGKMGPIIDGLTADVESGKIADMKALQAQLMSKFMGGAGGGAPDK